MAGMVGAFVGPDLQKVVQDILDACDVDKKAKEPLRRRLKVWQAAVVARMKALAPDDPDTGGSRIEKALRATNPVISRGRQRITAGFIVDGAKLGHSAQGKNKSEDRGIAWSIKQHEDLTLQHKRGSAKYMERPFTQYAPRVAQVVEEAFEEIASSIDRT